MPETAWAEHLLGVGVTGNPVGSLPWRRQEGCLAVRFFDWVGPRRTSYNLSGFSACCVPIEPVVTGVDQGAYDAVGTFHFALTGVLRSACPGTGGEPNLAEATMQSFISASGAYVVMESPPQPIIQASREGEGLTAVGEELALVRHYFSLSTTDLSKVLLVERPTVYAWVDGKWDPNPQNRGRIRRLYNLACNWRKSSSHAVGRFLKELIDGDQSLFDWLVQEPLDTAAVDRLLTKIQRLVDQGANTRRDRSVRAIAQQKGFKPIPEELERERFDRITRF